LGDPPPLPAHLVAELLLELAVLLSFTRALAELARRAGQPAVIGELVAGVLLGPTVLGRFAPGVAHAIFPPEGGSLTALESISWVGMVLTLFLLGAETDARDLVRVGRATFFSSVGGLVIPFGIGLCLGKLVPDSTLPEGVPRATVAVFMATAFTIASLPVVAKILQDLGLAKRDVGIVIIGAAVIDDIVGWAVLAVIASVATPSHGTASAKITATALALAGFLGGAALVAYPILKRATHWIDDHFKTPGSDVALYSALAFGAATLTDRLGIHAVFGAFVAGVVVRQVPRLRHEALERLEAVTASVLSPIFFAFAGLKVNLVAGEGLALAVVVTAFATAATVVGCFVGGRLGGLSSRGALVVGGALSARGAMGLVVAVVGRSIGVLSPTLYSVLVLMAMGTTLLAPILVRRFARGLPLAEHEKRRLEDAKAERVLELKAPKFLVPADASPHSAMAVAIGARFCKKEGATLTVLQVEPAPPGAPHAADALRAIAAAEGATLLVAPHREGEMAANVLAEAHGKDILLVAREDLLGPGFSKVLLEAPCHLVGLRVPGDRKGGRFTKLMVPFDGSVFARAALELALAFAHLDDKIEVAIVQARPGAIVSYLSEEEGKALEAELRKSLATVLERAPRPVSIHGMRGPDAVRALQAHAKAGDYDLLVVGAERQGGKIALLSGAARSEALLETGCAAAVVLPRF
jgi:Kef-type K+ transport system membrane component KefB